MQITQSLSTAEFAAALRVRPESIRHALCLRGAYMQIVPKKLPNGRLLWPAAEVQKLISPDAPVSRSA